MVVCGRTTLTKGELKAAGFDRVFALTEIEPDLARSIATAGPLQETVASAIAAEMLPLSPN